MAMKAAKVKKYYKGATSLETRSQLFAAYDDRYYNLWLSNYKWGGIERQGADFLMRRLWDTGMAAFYLHPLINTIGVATFAQQTIDQYHYPATGHLINQNGASQNIIPTNKLMVVDKDVVLIYALRSFTPFRDWVESQLSRIVDVEMTIRTNLFALKNPLLIPVAPEQHDRAQDTIDRICNDEPTIFTDLDPDTFKSIPAATNNIQSLYEYKVQLENELLTYMGIDNIGSVEKKERLIKDEANSNNSIINDYGDNVLRNFQESIDKVREIFGITLTVESTGAPAEESGTEDEEEKQDGKDSL